LAYVPLDLILPDQPNRAVRTRMLRGVGGAACEGRSYPDGHLFLKKQWPSQFILSSIPPVRPNIAFCPRVL